MVQVNSNEKASLMHVLNVNSTLGLKTGGGTAERTFQMSRHLGMREVKTTVLTLDIELDEFRKQALAPAKVVTLPCLWRRFYIPLGGWGIIKKLVHEADVVHLMGHWGILNALVYIAARRENKPYAVCPAGALPLFGRSALIKRVYNKFIGDDIVRNAAAWIAITDGEFMHFKNYGIQTSQITVIPNGVDEQLYTPVDRQIFLDRHHLPDAPIILFMGRLNPIKGPDLLLRAYIKARANISAYHLVFAGPDEGMLDDLRKQASEAGIADYIHFIGYVNGENKSAAYQHAKLLVVPSRQEAMSIVALEAGVCGTPALLTDQCGFSEVRKVDPCLEVSATVDGIATGLTNLLQDGSVVEQMSPIWKRFILKSYAWSNVVEKYIKLYEKIIVEQKEQ